MKQAKIDRIGNEGNAYLQTFDAHPSSRVMTDAQGEFIAEGMAHIEDFSLLPVITTVAATSAKTLLLVGTNAANAGATKAASGGVNLATAGADDDQQLMRGIANTGMEISIRPNCLATFRTQVNLTDFAEAIQSFGLNENPTDPDPSATAGEGLAFVAIPYASRGELTVDATVAGNGGLVEANFANWIIHEKVNGTDKYYATTVPVMTGADYELKIQMTKDMKANYYINGQLVRTGDTALTENDKMYVCAGLQNFEAGGAKVRQGIVRYISLARKYG
jgi:hypothetical protein